MPTPEELTTEELNAQQATNPALPPGTAYTPVNQTPNQEELMQGQQIDPTAVQTNTATANAPQQTQAAQTTATTVHGQTPEGQAAQGQVSDQAQVQAQTQEGATQQYEEHYQDTLDTISQAAEADERATVQYQYSQLMDFGPGEIPGWASGAVRAAQQTMAARGLGGSTMAGEAITAAILQAALPIAQQDAQVFKDLQLAELDKKSQAAFLKAGYLADMDMASLNNRQQAAVLNAQAFMQMDLANLDARQQMAIVNTQSRLQTLLSDQAATNAADQFNASSQNQIDMFYANLTAQIDTFNAAQLNEMEQFNAEMVDMREQFNVKNALLVEQANVQYLRDINTQNTARQNEANYINSQNLLEISNTAMANQIQLLRDREAFAFEMAENEKDRALSRYLEVLRAQNNIDLAKRQENASIGAAVGEFTANLLTGVVDNWSNIF